MVTDLDSATFAAIGLVLALGMTFFNLRLKFLFGRGNMSKAYAVFALSSVILVAVSSISVLQALGLTSLAASWREAAALIFRIVLFYGFYEAYKAWTKFGRN